MKDLEQARQKLRSNIDDKNSKLSVAAKDKPKAPALKPEQLKKGDAVRHRLFVIYFSCFTRWISPRS